MSEYLFGVDYDQMNNKVVVRFQVDNKKFSQSFTDDGFQEFVEDLSETIELCGQKIILDNVQLARLREYLELVFEHRFGVGL